MAESFDPYLRWLGIRDPERPPNHYRLLGVSPFEDDPDVLSSAADRQMSHVRTFQTGPHSAESQRLLNELAAAKICLLNREKKAAYDAELRRRFCVVPPTPPVEPPAAARLEPPVAAPPSSVFLETPIVEPDYKFNRGKTSASRRTKSSSAAFAAALWGLLALIALGAVFLFQAKDKVRSFFGIPQDVQNKASPVAR